MNAKIQSVIETAWEKRAEINANTGGDVRDAVEKVLKSVDSGELRVAEKIDGQWRCHQWVKQAILLSFRLNANELMGNGHWDKVPLKTGAWSEIQFESAGFRAVPGSVVRRGAFVAKNVVLMPSFINIGAYVGEGTMVDTWVTIGSCAQIGKHCHISGGVGIGGVLEPLQANPVIIEDNCFIGARSEVAEGVIVEEGSVISMGVFLGASTKIVDRATGEITYGRVPAYSVVVPGTLPGKTPADPHLAAAIIVKRADEKTRSKTSINELLRA
ncbi:MAG: 2,3,4,5-tetrahydropyridine-2,6-dicarboxylate N-succinyltransferase [Rickettsiales bacterium]